MTEWARPGMWACASVDGLQGVDAEPLFGSSTRIFLSASPALSIEIIRRHEPPGSVAGDHPCRRVRVSKPRCLSFFFSSFICRRACSRGKPCEPGPEAGKLGRIRKVAVESRNGFRLNRLRRRYAFASRWLRRHAFCRGQKCCPLSLPVLLASQETLQQPQAAPGTSDISLCRSLEIGALYHLPNGKVAIGHRIGVGDSPLDRKVEKSVEDCL